MLVLFCIPVMSGTTGTTEKSEAGETDGADYTFIQDIDAYSVKMMLSEMARNPSALHMDAQGGERKWNYTTGLELKSFLDVAQRYDLDYAVDFVKAWAGGSIANEDGVVYSYKKSNYNVDHVCPARIYFELYDRTQE